MVPAAVLTEPALRCSSLWPIFTKCDPLVVLGGNPFGVTCSADRAGCGASCRGSWLHDDAYAQGVEQQQQQTLEQQLQQQQALEQQLSQAGGLSMQSATQAAQQQQELERQQQELLAATVQRH